ncbi:hypothetical protein LCGC14_2002790, partial [marine sediment metagenome]
SASAADLRIGLRQGATQPFDGIFSGLRIRKRAPDPYEIRSAFESIRKI